MNACGLSMCGINTKDVIESIKDEMIMISQIVLLIISYGIKIPRVNDKDIRKERYSEYFSITFFSQFLFMSTFSYTFW